jgi:hypothetical protein
MLKAIVEPIVLSSETDQHSGGLPMPGDQYLLGFCHAQESGKIILDLSQRRLAYRASRGRQANAPLLTS